jgi:hypothetical protein
MMNLREKFFKNSEEEIDQLLTEPAISNSNSKSSIITFNFKIDDSEIYQVIKLLQKYLIFINSFQSYLHLKMILSS